MKISFANDWKKNPMGRAFSVIMAGYLNIPGLPRQITVMFLGIGFIFRWKRK